MGRRITKQDHQHAVKISLGNSIIFAAGGRKKVLTMFFVVKGKVKRFEPKLENCIQKYLHACLSSKVQAEKRIKEIWETSAKV